MAITNMNTLFDKLKEYIDAKISNIEIELRDLFEEYSLKEIVQYLNEIKTVADNLDWIQIVGNDMQSIITTAKNIQPIIDAPEYADRIEQGNEEAEYWHGETKKAKDFAWAWSSENIQVPVDDGIHQGYSAWHWASVAYYISQGLTYIGQWDPNSGSYPTPKDHGDFWLINKTGWCCNEQWYMGDKLIWINDGDKPGYWGHVYNIIDWGAIQNKPVVYPPSIHFHDDIYERSERFIMSSDGAIDAGKPIKLNAEGLVDNSMVKLPVVYLVGRWTPVPNYEYPDASTYPPGATWIIFGLQSNGFTFTSGDLAGEHVENGDAIIKAAEEWAIIRDQLNPEDYLRRDGTTAMVASLPMGGFKIVGLKDGVDDSDAATVGQLGTVTKDVFRKSEHVAISTGRDDRYKPIILNSSGLVDVSMLEINVFTFMGGWDPTAGHGEYPNDPSFVPGDFWIFMGLDDTLGYTYSSGDLAGVTVFNGDLLLLGRSSWLAKKAELDPNAYYRLNGELPLTNNFNAGGFPLSDVGEAVEETDAVILRQLDDAISKTAPIVHQHSPVDISPQGDGSLLDADMLDGLHASEFAQIFHNHAAGDIQPQGADSGLDADKLDGYHASEFRLNGDQIPWDDVSGKPAKYDPVNATEQVVGGVRIWADGNILNIWTTDYVAPPR